MTEIDFSSLYLNNPSKPLITDHDFSIMVEHTSSGGGDGKTIPEPEKEHISVNSISKSKHPNSSHRKFRRSIKFKPSGNLKFIPTENQLVQSPINPVQSPIIQNPSPINPVQTPQFNSTTNQSVNNIVPQFNEQNLVDQEIQQGQNSCSLM
jgi:hypothetical protein